MRHGQQVARGHLGRRYGVAARQSFANDRLPQCLNNSFSAVDNFRDKQISLLAVLTSQTFLPRSRMRDRRPTAGLDAPSTPTDIVAERAFDQRQLHSLLEQAVANPTALSSRWPGVVKPQNHMLNAVLTRTNRVRIGQFPQSTIHFSKSRFHSTKPIVAPQTVAKRTCFRG
jgi:hypothetical protein